MLESEFHHVKYLLASVLICDSMIGFHQGGSIGLSGSCKIQPPRVNLGSCTVTYLLKVPLKEVSKRTDIFSQV